MKIVDFKCHMCGEVFYGPAKTQITMVGFNWNPSKFDAPGYLYDLCPACTKVFVAKWLEGRADRRAEIEADKLATWQIRLGLVDPARRSGAAVEAPAFSPAWNYADQEHKHGARLYRSREKQQCWRF